MPFNCKSRYLKYASSLNTLCILLCIYVTFHLIFAACLLAFVWKITSSPHIHMRKHKMLAVLCLSTIPYNSYDNGYCIQSKICTSVGEDCIATFFSLSWLPNFVSYNFIFYVALKHSHIHTHTHIQLHKLGTFFSALV